VFLMWWVQKRSKTTTVINERNTKHITSKRIIMKSEEDTEVIVQNLLSKILESRMYMLWRKRSENTASTELYYNSFVSEFTSLWHRHSCTFLAEACTRRFARIQRVKCQMISITSRILINCLASMM